MSLSPTQLDQLVSMVSELLNENSLPTVAPSTPPIPWAPPSTARDLQQPQTKPPPGKKNKKTPEPAPPTTASSEQNWTKGSMTFYTGKEGASRGAGGKILTPFKSVAVKIGDFKRLQNKKLEIQGVGVVAVEDGCVGGACKDFDIYIGADAGNAKRLPNWKAGNIPINYRWV